MGGGKAVQAPSSPRRFGWIRRLWSRLRPRGSGRRSRGEGRRGGGVRDVEKWPEDASLTGADYPDYRWQVVTKGRAKRMVPSLVESPPEGQAHPGDPSHHHHTTGGQHRCACHTLRDLGMLHYEPLPPQQTKSRNKKSSSSVKVKQNSGTQGKRSKVMGGSQKPKEGSSGVQGKNSSEEKRQEQEVLRHLHHEQEVDRGHVHSEQEGHKCACQTLKEMGMLWQEPAPSSTQIKNPKVVTTMHAPNSVHKKIGIEDLAGEILEMTKKEVQIGKASLHMRAGLEPTYHPLDNTEDIPDEYPHLQKAVSDNRKPVKNSNNNSAPGTRYVPLPSASCSSHSSQPEQNHIDLDLTEVKVPVTSQRGAYGHVTGNQGTLELVPGNSEPQQDLDHHHHHLQAESDNDKNHLKSAKEFKSDKSKSKRESTSAKKPKTPKHRRSLKQKAERKIRKLTVARGYHKLREDDVDDDVIILEHNLNVKKQRQKYLKKRNVPEWMMGEETLVLQMRNISVNSPQDHVTPKEQHVVPPEQKNRKSGGFPGPRGSPRAQKGSPRYILYQMQQRQKQQQQHLK